MDIYVKVIVPSLLLELYHITLLVSPTMATNNSGEVLKKVAYEEVEDISSEENQKRLDRAFDTLFEELLKRLKKH